MSRLTSSLGRRFATPLLVIILSGTVCGVLCCLPSISRADPAPDAASGAGGGGQNPIFVDTHLLPSPLTLPGGRLQLGSYTAYGITGFLQVGTDLLSDAFQIVNVSAKLGLLDFQQFALALTGEWETYNYNSISSNNPNLRVTQWMPGAVAGVAVLPDFALFMGGNLNYASVAAPSSIATSGYVQGAEIESDVAWSYSAGYAVSGGVTYDLTYKIYGVGLSHHWPAFELGLHYYPNATDYQWRPIIAGGMAMNF